MKFGDLINYADDNTLIACAPTLDSTKSLLISDTMNLMHWINVNEMKANPSKFQVIFSNRNSVNEQLSVGDTVLSGQNDVKLLGIHIDRKLSFSQHISEICKKAGKQINVLARLCRFLSTEVKLLIYKSYLSCVTSTTVRPCGTTVGKQTLTN